MGKYEAKTKATEVAVEDFIAAVPDQRRREEAEIIDKLHRRVTGLDPKMWGPSMIGYGSYHYRYESGHEGDSLRGGFSPRKSAMTIYLMGNYVNRQAEADDLFARLGGEEFMLVLRDTQADTAQALAERIRQQVMALEFAPAGRTIRVTVSLGISFTADRHAPYDVLIRLADEALYAAKHKGRNRIEVRWHPA